MRDHVRILAIVNIVLGSLGLLIGLGAFLLLGGIGVAAGVANAGDPDAAMAAPVLGVIGSLIFLVILVFSAPQIVGGIGLLKMLPWARILMIVLSGLNLLSIPIGTLVGAYGLWVLLNSETLRLFEPGAAPPVQPVQPPA